MTLSDRDARIAAIETRANLATVTNWHHVTDPLAGIGFVCKTGEAGDKTHYVVPDRFGEWRVDGALHDAEFIAHSKQDVAWLIAELRGSLSREEEAKKDAERWKLAAKFCFFCDAPCDESEVCEACTPKACAVLGRVVDSCLAEMRGEPNSRSNVHGA